MTHCTKSGLPRLSRGLLRPFVLSSQRSRSRASTGASSRGFTVVELLLVLAVMAVMFMMTVPAISAIRTRAALQAARQQLAATLSAARSSAVQKAKWSTFTVQQSTVAVSVRSGLQATPHLVVAPLDLTAGLGVQVRPIGDTPDTLQFNTRGLLAPTPAHTLRFQLLRHGVADTLCLSPGGIVLPRGCTL